MVPSIGRIVHYLCAANDSGAVERHAAVIINVSSVLNEDGYEGPVCSLMVFHRSGFNTQRFNVRLGDGTKSGTWCWPERV